MKKELLNFNDLRALTGLSRSTISRLEKRGKFPKRINSLSEWCGGPDQMSWLGSVMHTTVGRC